MRKYLYLLALLSSSYTFSQHYGPGNVIPEYGKTFEIQSPEFETNTNGTFKALIDIDRQFDNASPNRLIETAARFLNMHEKAGVPVENMELALVVHGGAVFDLLEDEHYSQKYPGVKNNPNLPLIKKLVENGVQIIVCGQSAAHHQVTREKATNQVKFALSAMTALVQLQNDEYQLIKF